MLGSGTSVKFKTLVWYLEVKTSKGDSRGSPGIETCIVHIAKDGPNFILLDIKKKFVWITGILQFTLRSSHDKICTEKYK